MEAPSEGLLNAENVPTTYSSCPHTGIGKKQNNNKKNLHLLGSAS